ncbi:MAG: glutathione transferase GstA [Pseudomonadota bacterium]
MKLYYSTGTCSLSPHIALHEAGLPFEAVAVNIRNHTLKDGSDYRQISPKGYVPLLQLDNGETLTEGPAIVQYIADQVPDKLLAPTPGTWPRYKLQEWLNFITAELHKSFSPLFNRQSPEETKTQYRTKISERLAWVETQLAGRQFLTGDTFTVADGYLFTVCGWCQHVGVDIAQWPNLSAFMARVGERPSVKAALKGDGLIGLQ